MPPEIRTETRRGVTITIGKERMVEERTVITVTDKRHFAFGIYDFGHETLGPARWVRDSTTD